MTRVLIESVACSPDDAVEAEAGGADRLELCSAMVLGGLTPSLGTVIAVRAVTALPIVSMVRPRAGGFCYTARELDVMLRDVELALTHGVQGVVFGILDAEGRIDIPRCRQFIDHARAVRAACEIVFHRAFDVVADSDAGLETLVELGVTRVLTSGREPTALAGAPLIRALEARAAGRIEVLAGGGVRDSNVADVLRATGASQVHLGPFAMQPDSSGRANPTLSFSSHGVPPEGQYPLVDRAALRRVRAAAGG